MTPHSRATSTSNPRRAPPAFRFVGGKGGVGKTTCAAALAVASAAAGVRTLLVSTDPAPSLGDLFGVKPRATPRRVSVRRGKLEVVHIDAPRALARWLEPRIPILEEIALRGTWLDRDDVSRLFRQALPGIDEIAALLEIAALARSSAHDAVVVDTAPTGHTLRMFALPATLHGLARAFDHMQAKHRAIADALGRASRDDPADRLIDELESDAARLEALLRDSERVRITWVMLPEPMAVAETLDAIDSLASQGIDVEDVIVNRLTPPPPQPCSWCRARRAFEARTLADARRVLTAVPLGAVSAQYPPPRGVQALLAIARQIDSPTARRTSALRPANHARTTFPVGRSPVDPLGDDGLKLVLFGGKGGVGKTTCAAAASLDVAARFPGRRVLLISTDPAHSLADALETRLSDVPGPIKRAPGNLHVRELDASRQLVELRQRYRDAIDGLFDRITRGGAFDAAYDRQAMRDLIDLAPPGIDELAAVIQVTDAIAAPDAPYDLVVVDTAPSGHALRLLEMPALVQDWARALMAIVLKYQPVVAAGDLGRLLLSLSQGLGRLRELLADGERTRFVLITRAEDLAIAETKRLLVRLRRLGVPTRLILVNALGAGSCRTCTRQRRAQRNAITRLSVDVSRPAEAGHDVEIAAACAEMPPPIGCAALRRWRGSWRVAAQGHGGISSS